jgi:hypothetical protein
MSVLHRVRDFTELRMIFKKKLDFCYWLELLDRIIASFMVQSYVLLSFLYVAITLCLYKI